MGLITKTTALLFCSLIILLVIMNINGMAEMVNPHTVSIEMYVPACIGCHPNDPNDPSKFLILSAGLNGICESCHKKIPFSCMKAVTNEVTKILLEQIPNLVLTIRNESLTCDSCHLAHAGRGERMQGAYLYFLKQAERINPHRSGIFCIFCHEKEPRSKEDPIDLRFEGDRVAVCTQCHNNERARADNHPVNIRPSEGKGVNLDERFPLNDGKVTCVTCHDIKCQGEEINPKFLRGGPYETRVDACLVCHQKESYRAVNPHEQIDEQGRLRKDRCLYCHILDMEFTSKD